MALGAWLQTLGGGRLDLVNPRPEQIDPRVIARVLARIPRFGGHTDGEHIYSVAQHSREGARAIMRDTGREDAAAAFMWHDAHEAYIGDMPTPVQDALIAVSVEHGGFGFHVKNSIRSLKSRLDRAIYTRVGLPWPLDPTIQQIVHEYDLRMCRTERDVRLATPPCAWADAIEQAEPVQGCDLYPWSPGTVESLFLASAREYVDNPHLW